MRWVYKVHHTQKVLPPTSPPKNDPSLQSSKERWTERKQTRIEATEPPKVPSSQTTRLPTTAINERQRRKRAIREGREIHQNQTERLAVTSRRQYVS
ncbi:hypothetical protein M419DRAFT_124199 [Trichoderma reesei RUT C-30]|uniref:Uncharacterized protein n=1 Tax=Hypocrea jecorina (strain ATCC 56765 / BCRC 32924 / NRRL 11460 / Rut C-30) TaxID=1344414 RepID=A0A024S6U5_HYPJR|nr:hypothetical protein M419DRAFT_124199 [Trichoderma reesei RUT C-30]